MTAQRTRTLSSQLPFWQKLKQVQQYRHHWPSCRSLTPPRKRSDNGEQRGQNSHSALILGRAALRNSAWAVPSVGIASEAAADVVFFAACHRCMAGSDSRQYVRGECPAHFTLCLGSFTIFAF
mmetsp:Transcript_72862/g.136129  ORF Transcript_72862/g.136129 Transcript_72862/m.136129 type:complete len:123 (-) Transcript_72862:3-371(-)